MYQKNKEAKKMNENMNKPITIVRAEFISNLSNLINTSGLPPFIVESILKDVYVEVRNAAQKQYEMDVAMYEQLKNDALQADGLQAND